MFRTKLMSTHVSHMSPCSPPMPALLTTMSRRPNDALANWNDSATRHTHKLYERDKHKSSVRQTQIFCTSYDTCLPHVKQKSFCKSHTNLLYVIHRSAAPYTAQIFHTLYTQILCASYTSFARYTHRSSTRYKQIFCTSYTDLLHAIHTDLLQVIRKSSTRHMIHRFSTRYIHRSSARLTQIFSTSYTDFYMLYTQTFFMLYTNLQPAIHRSARYAHLPIIHRSYAYHTYKSSARHT